MYVRDYDGDFFIRGGAYRFSFGGGQEIEPKLKLSAGAGRGELGKKEYRMAANSTLVIGDVIPGPAFDASEVVELMPYSTVMRYKEFRDMLVEGDDSNPWGDDYFESIFGKYNDDGWVRVEYNYGAYRDGKSTIKWRIPDEDFVFHTKVAAKRGYYVTRYTGSSRFAMWWCGLTDDMEAEAGEEEEETCVKCDETKTESWSYNTTPVKNAPVCQECLDIETEVVSGIICKKCDYELPPMTMKQHLDGDFNKTCPHSN